MDSWTDYLRLSIGILAVVDPVGAIPVFLIATEDETALQRKRTALIASLTMAVTLLVFAWVGEYILYVFGIGMPAFQVGGGILLLLMSVSMLHAYPLGATHRPEEDEEARVKEAVGVVPLGIPLMAGPGSIALVIMDSNLAPGVMHSVYLSLTILVIALLVWAVLRAAVPLGEKLGRTGINTCTRLMGLILAAIAVELIAAGMLKLFPGLGG